MILLFILCITIYIILWSLPLYLCVNLVLWLFQIPFHLTLLQSFGVTSLIAVICKLIFKNSGGND